MTSKKGLGFMKKRLSLENLGRAVLFLAILAAAAVMLLPFLWMLSTSFKEPKAVFGLQLQLIPNPIVTDNYKRIFEVLPFGRFYWNSILTSASVTILQLVTCSFAGYAFARLRFPGRDALFLGYLATLMIPGQVTIIPNFILLRMLGWIDTYQALVLPNAFSAFGTFLLRQFFSTLPADLEDAAKIDGCSHFGIYRHVILPLSKPALSSLTVFTWLGQWNSFIWPLIVINSVEMNTLTVGLRTLQGQYNTQWTLLMSGSVLALLPVLILFVMAQRTFISGMTLSGMGGR